MKVSVVISVYNNARYLGEAVDSILGQEPLVDGDLECIVIDDGSTDGTARLLNRYDDPRLTVHRLPVNCGIGIARNVGMRCARGEYIAVMDSDDIAFPRRLAAQARFLDANPQVHILGTRVVRVRETPDNVINTPPHPLDDATIKARLLLLNGTALVHPTCMFRKQFLDQHRLLYPSRNMDEDHELFAHCVAAGARFHALEDVLLYKRRHDGNITTTAAATKDEGKIPLRRTLLSMYFPQLTTLEAHSLALLFQQGGALTLDQAKAGLQAGTKALSETRSFYGESRPQLADILRACLGAVSNAVKSFQARP